jgi:nucleoside-diphosphate-sugar epimerase/GT2 family glycosyltransferase
MASVPTISISASLVLYKPDFKIVERAVLALQVAGQFAKKHYPLELSLTLVDNSDDDGVFSQVTKWFGDIRAKLPDWEIKLLKSAGNVGYGRGNNLVIETIQSDYHIVINPDLFVTEGALLEALRYMEAHPGVGLLSPSVVGEDGAKQYLCKRNPTLFIMFLRSFAPEWVRSLFRYVLDEFEMRDCDYRREIHPVEYPSGCFMFFRTAPLKALGGYDPKIFLHYEDADIGRRMLMIARVNYVPSVIVVHKWSRDTHKYFRSMLSTARSGLYYWRKWGGTFSNSPAKEPVLEAQVPRGNLQRDSATGQGRKVFVTGASGFIARAVCAELPLFGFHVLGAVRKLDVANRVDATQYVEVGNVDENTDWSALLAGVDCIVHLAARVHVMRDTSVAPLAEYRRDNVAMTLNLARQAVASGVRRFVFISSIKVNGERTPIGQPFTPEDIPKPEDFYGISKLEAEQALLKLAKETKLEVVIIRPPLVYGPGVKANFQTMVRWLAKGVPLPLGSLDNRRSLVALDNLVSLIVICLHHPAAANQTFLVSDGQDLSVTELLRRTATMLRVRTVLVPVPRSTLKLIAALIGRGEYVKRLTNSLQIDLSKNVQLLNWTPPISVDDALSRVVNQYLGGYR